MTTFRVRISLFVRTSCFMLIRILDVTDENDLFLDFDLGQLSIANHFQVVVVPAIFNNDGQLKIGVYCTIDAKCQVTKSG